MFFITRLTENTNLAVVLPPHEGMFNTARLNITLARPKFAELDVGMTKRNPAAAVRPDGDSRHQSEELVMR
jgi:Ras-related GTP-binding protein A/B